MSYWRWRVLTAAHDPPKIEERPYRGTSWMRMVGPFLKANPDASPMRLVLQFHIGYEKAKRLIEEFKRCG